MTKFLNISTDNTLGGSSASDEVVSSQKAIKEYVDTHGGGGLPSQTGNAGKFLTTDGTNASWGNALTNTATGNYSTTIDGTASTTDYTVNMGKSSSAIGSSDGGVAIGYSAIANGGVSIGYNSQSTYPLGIALGYSAKSQAGSAYQIGQGTNTEVLSLYVGWGPALNYKLLDSTGKIPDARLNNPVASQTGNSGKFLTTDGTNASWGIPSTFKLFHHDWFDYELNDQNWLRADTFSWQDGTVYSDAYDHLVDDIDGKTATSETIGSYTISYYLADDGHKITTDETTVANIYNESGVAWYYIIDTANQRFKLPRTKYGFTGLRDAVGKYVPETLPNIKGELRIRNSSANTGLGTQASASGAFKLNTTGTAKTFGDSGGSYSVSQPDFNASWSSSTYQDNAPVQQRATQMYLYFYVGQFSQSATEQTAGLNSSLFNDKADIDLSNAASNASAGAKQTIVGWGMPDFANGISMSNLDTYQNFNKDGFVKVYGTGGGSISSIGYSISIDGTNSLFDGITSSQYSVTDIIPLTRGVYIKRYNNKTTSMVFYPCKGE